MRKKGFARILDSEELVEDFVDNILKIPKSEKREAIRIILGAERNMAGYEYVPTLTHTNMRDYEWRTPEIRDELRKQICNELTSYDRLDDDEEICLGKGGAVPITGVKNEKKAYYISGLPACGKSGIASAIASECGAYILDSDYAKRKLPEFTEQVGAASLVHDESDVLIFGYEGISLFEHCCNNGYNMVIPKIGSKVEKINEFCSGLQIKLGYSVYLINVDLDRVKATRRAFERFKKTKRYVPLSIIFDEYANEPTLNYFRIKNSRSSIYSGFAQISTDVEKGKDPILVENDKIDILNTFFKAA